MPIYKNMFVVPEDNSERAAIHLGQRGCDFPIHRHEQ